MTRAMVTPLLSFCEFPFEFLLLEFFPLPFGLVPAQPSDQECLLLAHTSRSQAFLSLPPHVCTGPEPGFQSRVFRHRSYGFRGSSSAHGRKELGDRLRPLLALTF